MAIWTIWLIIAGFFLILEILTEGFLVVWLGIGSLCALAVSFFFPEAIAAQIIVTAIVSIILILSTRKLSKKFSSKNDTPMNVYTILGKKAIVSQTIDNIKGQGRIKIDSDTWAARNDDGDELINEGDTVEVVRIDGVKAIVRKI